MSRTALQEDLDALRAAVLDLGALVRERLEIAIEALAERSADDPTDALETVVDGDSEVNDRYLAIEAQCIDLLALQQPVASDLRTVAASFKISTDLERIADLAVNLAEQALAPPSAPSINLRGVGEVALTMVEAALAAYEREDTWVCNEVAATDDELDALCERASEELFRELLADDAAEDVEAFVRAAAWQLLTIRDLERVGDHAVNIAARTLYMIDQDDALLY
jgi:phosphate transport system protein